MPASCQHVPGRQRQLVWIFVTLGIVLCADQLTKAIIIAKLPLGSVWPPGSEQRFFWFTHETNRGLVGGMFNDKPVVAYIAPILACGVLLYLYSHLNVTSNIQSMAYGMIGGGAIGNIADRFRLGQVTDFLQFHFYFVPFDFPWKRYPAFNVADSAICIGVFLLILGWRKMGHADVADNT
ncbi:MAG TPA: signal peptidase II [Candidatus Hydrogenedentes bacterium]|nr:signal peptidase II [Candidatus Hydrogenedentota bacterium]